MDLCHFTDKLETIRLLWENIAKVSFAKSGTFNLFACAKTRIHTKKKTVSVMQMHILLLLHIIHVH